MKRTSRVSRQSAYENAKTALRTRRRVHLIASHSMDNRLTVEFVPGAVRSGIASSVPGVGMMRPIALKFIFVKGQRRNKPIRSQCKCRCKEHISHHNDQQRAISKPYYLQSVDCARRVFIARLSAMSVSLRWALLSCE